MNLSSLLQGGSPDGSTPLENSPLKLNLQTLTALRSVHIDLTGSEIVGPLGESAADDGRLSVANFRVTANPMHCLGAEVRFDLSADRFQVVLPATPDPSESARAVLQADAMRLMLEISQSGLASLVTELANGLLHSHKITLSEVSVAVTLIAPRCLSAQIRLKARRGWVAGTTKATVRIDVSDDLDVLISDLQVQGEGIVGRLFGAVANHQAKKLGNQTFPLKALDLSGLQLKSIECQQQDPLRIVAHLASKAAASVV